MQCAKCGKSLRPGLDQCPACGSFVDATAGGVPFWTGTSGIPVAQLAPSVMGPPAVREPYTTANVIYVPHKIGGYRAVQLPPRPAGKRRWPRLLRLLFPLLGLVGLLAMAPLCGIVPAGHLGPLHAPGSLAASDY